MMKSAIHKAIRMAEAVAPSAWIAMLCTAGVLLLTVLPVESGCSAAEKYLCLVIPATAISGFIISLKRGISVSISLTDLLVAGWYLYSMVRLWLDATYPASGFATRSTMMLMLYASFRILFSSARIKWEGVALLIILFAIAEACMGYSQLISGGSRHHLYPVTGSFLNPGPYSAYLDLGILLLPALTKNLFNKNGQLQTGGLKISASTADNAVLILTMLLSVPLALTMSRAAFLSLFVCLIILYRNKIKTTRHWALLIAAFATIAICLYFLKSQSADGRGIINYIGIRSIIHNPLFGSGIGSFLHQYAGETRHISIANPDFNLNGVDVIDYAFNDLLLVGVEQGVIGLLFVFSLIAVTLKKLWKFAKPLFVGALSLLIISLFSYPFELLPYQIIITVITACAATAGRKSADAQKGYNRCKGLAIAISMSVIICAASACNYHYIISKGKAEKEYNMISGLHDRAFTKDYYSLLPYLYDDKRFLFDFGRLLSEQRRYNDSNDMLRRGELVSNDPMFIILQGNNYRDMGAYDEAESAYIRACHTIPNRIYPLYRLMKLHEQLGNTGKASAYAGQVVAFKEKIPSPAVTDMKREAQEIIKLQKH